MYSNVHYKVYYSEMGFEANPQNYIVDTFAFANEDQWIFNRVNSNMT